MDRNGNKVRWKDHLRKAKSTNPILLIDKKIKEYGINNFNYSILFEENNISINSLKIKEQYYIKKLKSHVKYKMGYNLTKGGDNNPMDNENVRKNHLVAMKKTRGKNHYMYGKKWPKELNIQRSLSMKGKNSGDKNVFKRLDVRKKISYHAKLRIGDKNPNFKYRIDKNELYNYYVKENHTLKETSQYFNCSIASTDRKLRNYKIRKPKLKIDETVLYELYIHKNKTIKDCYEFFGCSAFPIKKIIRKNGWYKRVRN